MPSSSPSRAQALDQRDAVEPARREVDDQHRRAVGARVGAAELRLVAAARSIPSTLEPSSRSSKTATTRATGYCARMRRNSWRTDSGRPHIWVVSTRPVRHSRSIELAVDARVVEQLQRAVHGGRRGGVAELVGDEELPVPVVVRVGQRVAGHDERRGVDVAVLVDAQVDLQVGPVRRERVDDLLEVVRERHDSASEPTCRIPPIPTTRSRRPAARASTGLLALLEQLEGAEEAAVARSALARRRARRAGATTSSSARSSGGCSAPGSSTMRQEW